MNSKENKAKIVAIANQKGGVGKTLFTRLLAHYLAEVKHRKVLVIDFDSQAHSTIRILPDWAERGGSPRDTSDMISGRRPLAETITKGHEYGGGGRIDLVVSSNLLADEETATAYAAPGKGLALRDVLYEADDVLESYDVVLIDNGPGPMLQRLSIAAADAILVPMEPTEESRLSTEAINADMRRIAKRYNAGPCVIGYVINRYDPTSHRMAHLYELTASDLGKQGFILGPIRRRGAYENWPDGAPMSSVKWPAEVRREINLTLEAICDRIEQSPHQEAKFASSDSKIDELLAGG